MLFSTQDIISDINNKQDGLLIEMAVSSYITTEHKMIKCTLKYTNQFWKISL